MPQKKTKENKLHDAIIKSMEDVLAVQSSKGNWDVDPYMHGMLNGMILMHALATNGVADFKSAPNYWLSRSQRFKQKAAYRIRLVFVVLRNNMISNLTGLVIDYKEMCRIKAIESEEN